MTKCDTCGRYTHCILNGVHNSCSVGFDELHQENIFDIYSYECLGQYPLEIITKYNWNKENCIKAFDIIKENLTENTLRSIVSGECCEYVRFYGRKILREKFKTVHLSSELDYKMFLQEEKSWPN